MSHELTRYIPAGSVITAVRNEDDLAACLKSGSKVVFILYGDLCSIPDIVRRVRDTGRYAVVHVDLISGLSGKEIAVDFIKTYTQADGIISTRPGFIRRAKELRLLTVLRFFAIDSMAYGNIRKELQRVRPDFIEILPGPLPDVMKKICRSTTVPVIAGGLINASTDLSALYKAGVRAVSTSDQIIRMRS